MEGLLCIGWLSSSNSARKEQPLPSFSSAVSFTASNIGSFIPSLFSGSLLPIITGFFVAEFK